MPESVPARVRLWRRHWVVWPVLGVVLVVLFCAVWIAVRASLAKTELQASIGLVSTIQTQVADGDAKAAVATTAELEKRVHSARDDTSDPIWRAAEIIPLLGPNLEAVRSLSSVVSDVTDHSIKPIAGLIGSLDLSSFRPVDGVIPIRPMAKAAPTIAAADTALRAGLSRVRGIDTSKTVTVVTEAVDRLRTELQKAAAETGAVSRAAQLLPEMLGRDGPRNYLLLVQNNAETRSTGGIAGALALLHVQDGAITLKKQASTSDFPAFSHPVMKLPKATRDLYGELPAEHIQDVNLTPRFPLSAELARQMWQQRFGVKVDGVLSIDPVALSYLLSAMGPVTLDTGDRLTADNAVKLLLSDAYARYDDPRKQDAFFASAAAEVFNKVTAGDIDPSAMITALARAGDEHRLLVWSSHPEEQASLAQTSLSGVLPRSSPTERHFGIYLNDATGAKMDYYLRTEVGLGSASCRSDGRANYLVTVTLTNSAPMDAAEVLPEYVTGGGRLGVSPGSTHTTLVVYSPPGSVLVGVTGDGKPVPVHRAVDAGRTIGQLLVKLKPGQSSTYAFHYIGAAHDRASRRAAMTAHVTPGVVPAKVKHIRFGCSDLLR